MITRYPKLIFLLLAPTYVGTHLLLWIVSSIYTPASFGFQAKYSLFCIVYLNIWWAVYFLSSRLKVFSLRLFLREKSKLRIQENNNEGLIYGTEALSLNTKISSVFGSQAMYLAVVALFLSLAMAADETEVFTLVMKNLSYTYAIIAILLMILSVDILDTVANDFKDGALKATAYKNWFFKQVGVAFPKGAISYAYVGYATLTIFIITSLSVVKPVFAVLGASFYTYLAFPFLLGYRGQLEGGVATNIEPDM